MLDEATASLDVDNETLIQEALSRLIQNKTVLIIAHRMRTVAQADKIVVLAGGRQPKSARRRSLRRRTASTAICFGRRNRQQAGSCNA